MDINDEKKMQEIISFTCDYSEGAHPDILKRLIDTNMMQEEGYGYDRFTVSAREKIKENIGCADADVFFLVGGTQTNSTIIAALLKSYEGVVSTATGHIAVHEAGAVELSGHKVLTIGSHEGKMKATELDDYINRFYADPTWPHMVSPGMAYISFPTEYGTLYSKNEIEEIRNVCRKHNIPLFIDGARLGYALASNKCDVSLRELAQLCDVFYIGATKIGALCGEAVVFPKGDAPKNFFSIVKQHGALLAKGRLLGVQFDTLFTNDLYMRISRHAIDAAMTMKKMMNDKGIEFYVDSPTNQQFPILSQEQMERLEGKVLYEVWEKLDSGRAITRFATSWATPMEHIERLAKLL